MDLLNLQEDHSEPLSPPPGLGRAIDLLEDLDVGAPVRQEDELEAMVKDMLRAGRAGPATGVEESWLDEMGAVGDKKAAGDRGNKGREELIPGLLGSGKWRRLKGGVTMDSGCSIDTMPVGHAPNVKLDPTPPERRNRKINAANGTRIQEHGVKKLKFKTRDGKRQTWDMIATDVRKALKSVATTCDGKDTGECHVIFTKSGGYIVNVEDVKGHYSVGRQGTVRGAGEVVPFDRTGNTYGMEAWVYVGDQGRPDGFSRQVAAP